MMGGSSSKMNCSNTVKPSPDLAGPTEQASESGVNLDSGYFSFYEEACKSCPDVGSFDETLRQKTMSAIFSAIDSHDGNGLSLGLFKVAINSFTDGGREVAKILVNSKQDICKDTNLLALVDTYFENSLKTLELCTALEKCLSNARKNQLLIKVAFEHFDKEFELQKNNPDGTFPGTLKNLQMFVDAGDPFTEELSLLFQTVYLQQASILDKLQDHQNKIDKKIKSLKTWKKVSTVLFVAAFVSVLVLSVVAAAIAAPPVVTALAGALSVPIGSSGKWCNSLWDKYIKEVKNKKELVTCLHVGTRISLHDVSNINALVSLFKTKMESTMQLAEMAEVEELGVKILMEEIRKEVEAFTKTIEEISLHTEKCRQHVKCVREAVVDRIARFPGK